MKGLHIPCASACGVNDIGSRRTRWEATLSGAFLFSEIGAAPSRVQLGDAANHNAIEVTSWLSMSLHEFRPPSLGEAPPHDQPAI
jgi:hypothetical protein